MLDEPPKVLPLRDGVALKLRFRRAVGSRARSEARRHCKGAARHGQCEPKAKEGGLSMPHDTQAFVAFQTSELAECGARLRRPDVRVRFPLFGRLRTVQRLVPIWYARFAVQYARLTFCSETGPRGSRLHRQIKGLGQDSLVVDAVARFRSGRSDRVKTNRSDAMCVVKLLRAEVSSRSVVPDRTP